MKIFKYRLPLSDEIWTSKIQLPKTCRVLCAGAQGAEIYVWAIISEAVTETEEFTFHVEPTGLHDFNPEGWAYLNTVFMGPYVWHVFLEVKYPNE